MCCWGSGLLVLALTGGRNYLLGPEPARVENVITGLTIYDGTDLHDCMIEFVII